MSCIVEEQESLFAGGAVVEHLLSQIRKQFWHEVAAGILFAFDIEDTVALELSPSFEDVVVVFLNFKDIFEAFVALHNTSLCIVLVVNHAENVLRRLE